MKRKLLPIEICLCDHQEVPDQGGVEYDASVKATAEATVLILP
jgi:hypothetical protein